MNPQPSTPSNGLDFDIVMVAPVIDYVAPNPVRFGQSIRVTGNNFGVTSVIQIRGSAIATTLIDSRTLSAIVPSAVGGGNASLTVENRPPSGIGPTLVSGSVDLTILDLAPIIDDYFPRSEITGATIFLTVTGRNFVGGAVLRFDGQEIPTTSAPDRLSGNVTLGGPGTVLITVEKPGGFVSNPASFVIDPPVPVITDPVPTLSQVFPSSGVQGFGIVATLTGTGFVTGSTTVNVSGSGVVTGSVSVTSPAALSVQFFIAASAVAG